MFIEWLLGAFGERIIANSLTEVDYSRNVGVCHAIRGPVMQSH